MLSHGSSGSGFGVSNEMFLAPSTGWVHSISIRLSAARTAGQCSVQCFDNENDYALGPYVKVSGGNDGKNDDILYDRGLPYLESTTNRFSQPAQGDIWNFFSGGTRLNVKSRNTSASTAFAPSTADGLACVTFAFIDERGATNPNHS